MENVENKLTVSRVKNILYTEIKSYQELFEKKKNLTDRINVVKSIIDIISSSNEVFEMNSGGLQYLINIAYAPLKYTGLCKKLENEFYRIKFTSPEEVFSETEIVQSVIGKLVERQDELEVEQIKVEKEIKAKSEKVFQYKWFLKNIKNNGYISTKVFDIFVDLLREYGYSTIDALKINELIVNNYKYHAQGKTTDFSVLKMLDANFEKYEITELDHYLYKDKYKSLINSFYETLEKNDIDYITLELSNYNEEFETLEEFDYFYQCLINKIVDNIDESLTDIKNVELYKELKYDIQKEYKMKVEVYKFLKVFYYKERVKIESKFIVPEKENIDETKIIYLERGMEDTYLEKDIRHMPEQLYGDMKDLIERLKTNRLLPNEFKGFNNNRKLRDFMELKDDQIRILFRRLANGVFVAVGAFQKKDDNDIPNFITLVDRYNDIPKEELASYLEKSKGIEGRIYDYLEENSRKTNR